LYRSSLRFELAQRTSWRAWRSFEGVDHVVGMDEGYRALWSGHHRDRGEKLSWSRGETITAWSTDRAKYVALGESRPPSRDIHVLDEHTFASAFEGRSEVARRHVVASWANAATFGHNPTELLQGVDVLYPQLRDGRGIHESVTSVARARLVATVRELGPRPLDVNAFERWHQRSRERDRSREDRSR
jgi:hypothetical protein